MVYELAWRNRRSQLLKSVKSAASLFKWDQVGYLGERHVYGYKVEADFQTDLSTVFVLRPCQNIVAGVCTNGDSSTTSREYFHWIQRVGGPNERTGTFRPITYVCRRQYIAA
jgi:hypothetical protein